MNPASEDIKYLLEGESSLGLVFQTDLFIGTEPDMPNDCVTIFDTPGRPPQLTLTKGEDYFYPSVQIRVRHSNYVDGYKLMHDIRTFLHGTNHETVNGTMYTLIKCSIEPSHLGQDSRKREWFVATFDLQRR